jgi:hypothetical protein
VKRVFLLSVLLTIRPCIGHAQERVLPARAAAQPARISLYDFEFKEYYFGREGPSYSSAQSEPSKRAQQLAEARLSGEVATAKFEAIDQNGISKALYLFKVSDALDDDEYLGFVDVPEQPFRVVVSGQDLSGAPYRRTYERLFRPKDEPLAPPRLPPGFSAGEAAQLTQRMLEGEREYKAEFEAKRRASPDGVNVMPRIQVTNVTHEPYRSPAGSILGIRLSYDVQFSKAGLYAMTPSLTPFFENDDLRGSVDMKVAADTISPRPDPLGQQYSSGFHGFILPAEYKSGVVYHFQVDLVPDFAIQNAAKTKYCIYNRQYQSSPRASSNWETLKSQVLPVRFGVSIQSVNFSGEIPETYSQKIFYEGFLREGAQDCGPNPNINF